VTWIEQAAQRTASTSSLFGLSQIPPIALTEQASREHRGEQDSQAVIPERRPSSFQGDLK
jgi:hypothetical protein